ncbi:RAP domain [Fragilaria crotonensis]|nr:RAP domain [Fragilaria crotonensis]
MALGKNGKWKEILTLYQDQRKWFNPINYSTVMNQLGRIPMVRRKHPVLGIFISDLSSRLNKRGIKWIGGTRLVANVIHAIAKLGLHGNDDAMQIVMLLEDDEKHAKWMFEKGTIQHISNCIWAFAKLGIKSHILFGLLEQNAERLVKEGQSQSISNCLWACGKVGFNCPTLFELAEQDTGWLADADDPTQAIAASIWACGQLGIKSPHLFEILDQHAASLTACPHLFSNSIEACGTLGIKAPNLFRVLEENTDWLWDRGTPQTFTRALRGCALLGINSPRLFELLEQKSDFVIEHGTASEVATCIWACAKIGVITPNLLELLAQKAEWLIDTGHPQDIAMCASSLSFLGFHSPALFSALEGNLTRFLLDSNAHDLCNMCYAMAVHGPVESQRDDVLAVIWNWLLDTQITDMPMDGLKQVLYIEAFAAAFGVQLVSPSLGLRNVLDQVRFTHESSTYKDEVSDALNAIGFSHIRDLSPFEPTPGLLSIDLACVDRMIAIECNGPNDYLSVIGDPLRRVENGPTKAKRRLLRQLGWQVINLNWEESVENHLSHDWLKGKLYDAGVKV